MKFVSKVINQFIFNSLNLNQALAIGKNPKYNFAFEYFNEN